VFNKMDKDISSRCELNAIESKIEESNAVIANSMQDVVQCLQPETVPPGYVFHTCRPGMFSKDSSHIFVHKLL